MPSPIFPSSTSGGGISNPNTSDIIFSDPARTFLLGDSAIYSDISTTISAGAQILIQSHTGDANRSFAVVGAWRNGVSGERYYTAIWPDTHLSTNAYITLEGAHNYNIASSPPSGYMLNVENDVPTGQLLAADFLDTGSEPGRFVKAYGKKDGGGSGPIVWEQGAQGTLYLYNPYGQTGTVQYTKPQAILGDIGSNYASPSWTYSSIRQAAGHLRIGSYVSNVEGDELDISVGAVSVTGTFSASTSLKAPIIKPTSDSTTALQITKADGTTRVIAVDTTNARVGINKTPGAYDIDVNGAGNVGGTLFANKIVSGAATDPGLGQQGDIIASRSASTGVYYFGGASVNAYLFFDATNIQISKTLVPAADASFDLGSSGNRFANAFIAGTTKTTTLNIASGGSTTISTGVGSVKMSTGNAATNSVFIPMQYAGTTYYVPGYTTNAP